MSQQTINKKNDIPSTGKTHIPVYRAIGYGVGDYGMNLFWNSLSLLLLFYYTQVAGVEPRLAGAIFFIGTLWDALTDPVMAAIAERTNTRWGRYRPFLLVGGSALCIAFTLLMLPLGQHANSVLFLVVTHLLFRTCYTAVSVPYSALSSKMTEDGRERTLLSGYRMFFAFLGFFTVSALAFPIVRITGDGTDTNATGFFWFACICAATAFVCYLVCFLATTEKPVSAARPSLPRTLRHARANLINNRSLHTMAALIFCQSSSNLVFLSMMAFFVQANAEFLKPKEAILGANALAMLVMIPVWTYVAHRFGKRKTWAIASTVVIAAGLHLALSEAWIVSGWVIQIIIMACGQGAFGILVWSMIPDTIEYGAWKTGVRSEAAAFGAALFVQKTSIGLAGLALGFLLSAIGYNAAQEVFSDEIGGRVQIIVGLGPALLLSIALIPLAAHPISRAAHQAALAALRKKDESSEANTVASAPAAPQK